MKALIILMLAPLSLLGQSSTSYYIAKGSNTCHHNDNVLRAIKGIYGKPIPKNTSFKLPAPNPSFNIYESGSKKGGYKFYKRIPQTEPNVQKYIVLSEKDKEYQCVTISQRYLILYRHSLNIMEIYKL